MNFHTRVPTDIDYAAYLRRVRCATPDEAFDALDPQEKSAGADRPDSDRVPVAQSDCFAFYQTGGRWAWQRLNQDGEVVDASSGSFRHYLRCVADAGKHGWKGRPVSLFAASGFGGGAATPPAR